MSAHLFPLFSNRVDKAKHAHLLLLLPVVLACTLPGLVKKAVDEAQKPTIIKSTDGRIQLTVPGVWREDKKLNESAVLQAADRFQEMYVIVIDESKQDYVEGNTLEQYTSLSRNSMVAALKEPQVTDPVSMVVSGYPAMEYVLEGSVENVKVKYICTAVETPNHYYQIVTWTLPSRFQKNQAQLREITQSFKELNK